MLIALWADGTEFEYRLLDPEHAENMDELKRRWPFGQFPLLIDKGETVVETTRSSSICRPATPAKPLDSEGDADARVRFLDAFSTVRDEQHEPAGVRFASSEGSRDLYGVEQAMAQLRIASDWLEANLSEGPWAVGDQFTLADCAAAPSLFYADWVQPIGPSCPKLAAYRARLLAHPIVARAVDEARPYRHFFPLGAPDRD